MCSCSGFWKISARNLYALLHFLTNGEQWVLITVFLESAICCLVLAIWLILCMLHTAPAALCCYLEKARQREHTFFPCDFILTKSLWHTKLHVATSAALTNDLTLPQGTIKVWAGNLDSKYLLIWFFFFFTDSCRKLCLFAIYWNCYVIYGDFFHISNCMLLNI